MKRIALPGQKPAEIDLEAFGELHRGEGGEGGTRSGGTVRPSALPAFGPGEEAAREARGSLEGLLADAPELPDLLHPGEDLAGMLLRASLPIRIEHGSTLAMHVPGVEVSA